jgi:hypothetical protein
MTRIHTWTCPCSFQTDTTTPAPPLCRDCGKPMEPWLSRHSARSGVTAGDIDTIRGDQACRN